MAEPKLTEATARKRVDYEIDAVGYTEQLLNGRRGLDGGRLQKKQVGGKTQPKSNFEKFIEQVEDGFVDKTPAKGDLPYGKPKSQRPKIEIL